MTTQLKTWGNSKAVRIPAEAVRESGIEEGEDLSVYVSGRSILLAANGREEDFRERITAYAEGFRYVPVGEDIMSVRQEAYSKIDSLPDDDSIRMIIGMIDQYQKYIDAKNDAKKKKMAAFSELEKLKKELSFPENYDYDKARREAVNEKYGSVN